MKFWHSFEVMIIKQNTAVQVKMGQIYPLVYATHVTSTSKEESKGLLAMTGTEAITWVTMTMVPNEMIQTKRRKMVTLAFCSKHWYSNHLWEYPTMDQLYWKTVFCVQILIPMSN
jgi:hypothetical protein